MSEHIWIVEEIDGGPCMGVGKFFICMACKASGGPTLLNKEGKPSYKPFFADGTGLKLTESCEESQAIIAEHLKTRKEKYPHIKFINVEVEHG